MTDYYAVFVVRGDSLPQALKAAEEIASGEPIVACYPVGFMSASKMLKTTIAPNEKYARKLRQLYRDAGKPSFRVLAAEVECSHSTIADILNCKRMSDWQKVEKLIKALNGNPDEFLPLWLESADPNESE